MFEIVEIQTLRGRRMFVFHDASDKRLTTFTYSLGP